MPEGISDLKKHVEGHEGILVIRASQNCRNWNGIQYKAGMSAKNVGAKKLSMNVATIPPGGVAAAHIHVDFEVMLYILEGRVRHEYGPGLTKSVENAAGDFIFIEPGVPHEVFNVSKTQPVVAVVARSDASEWENIIPYDRRSGKAVSTSGATRPSRADLSALWEEHVKHEFETRNHVHTLETMVDDAYVNHIPTLTGGVGKAQLGEFYSKRFIPQMPPDTSMTAVSRTIGIDRLVDEMIFKFTHTIQMDWMLPGIPPTGKQVEVPLVAIVHFRDGKLAHEHIYWDQASVLVQLGLLDPNNLPVAGVESARKVLDKTVPSNTLIARADRRQKHCGG